MKELLQGEFDPREETIAIETLERYSGSRISQFQPMLLVTNFPRYIQCFADERGLPVVEGSMFKVCHSKEEGISMLDFKIGSPAAALTIDLCSHLPIKAALLLGMCGGLRKHYKIGDYFVPVAAIRGEGTSDFYFPPEVPSIANFMVQKAVTNVLCEEKIRYHIGIAHTTNKRFWEFNKEFRARLQATRPQAIEMECATLFTASYRYKLPLGALLLVSDLPLGPKGAKTKKSSAMVFQKHTHTHVNLGVKVIHELKDLIAQHEKGVFRGHRKRFEAKK